MHQPDLLLLDEPMSGLDPVVRGELATLVREQTGFDAAASAGLAAGAVAFILAAVFVLSRGELRPR